jgi:ABC-type nitrate/sulfonate/bicarbonate transport system substrate-binding protein/ribulose-5-phosphate 4-epimerase/fuculose-1-phosphate aldolase
MSEPLPQQIWFTRCPVPTATGLAYRLDWLAGEFSGDGVGISTLQDAPKALARHHYDHEIDTLIREGGSLLALAARAQGAETRLIGLTWIDEGQAILVRPYSGIRAPEHLKGLRLALPAFIEREVAAHVRGSSIARGMSLQGYKGVLAAAGLTLDDVELVEVGGGQGRAEANPGGLWEGITALVAGKVDAVYVKGASALEAAAKAGVVIGIDIDKLPGKRFRVNNGTPRPITVHQRFLDRHFDLVVRFLAQTLRAADWAADNLEGVRAVLKDETRAGDQGVAAAYRDDFHKSLHPELSSERLALFNLQKRFMLIHGFLDRDFSLDDWVDAKPLQAARELLNTRRVSAQSQPSQAPQAQQAGSPGASVLPFTRVETPQGVAARHQTIDKGTNMGSPDIQLAPDLAAFVNSVKQDAERAFRVLRETNTTSAYGTVGFVVRVPGPDQNKLVVVNDPGPWERGKPVEAAVINIDGTPFAGQAGQGGNRYAKLFATHASVNIISHVHTPYAAAWAQTHRSLPLTYVAFQRHHLLREIPIYIDRRQPEVDFIIEKINENPHNTAILEANGGGTVWGKGGIREHVENIILFEEGAQLALLAQLAGGARNYGPGVLLQNWKMTGLYDKGLELGLVPPTDVVPVGR